MALLAGAVSGYSQGEVVFNLYSSTLKEVIYNTQANASTPVSYGGVTVLETVGNSTASIQKPAGTTVYQGAGLSGTGYDVQLLAGPAGTAAAGLLPVSSIFNFKTGAATLGLMAGSQAVTLPSAYGGAGAMASLAVAAWNNEGGTVTSLANAVAGGTPWGISPVVQFALVTSPTPSPAMPTTIQGFSLGTVPEPSTIALGVMGASTLLFRRRK